MAHRSVAIATDVANALAYLHERGCAHGEQLENVLLTGQWRAKLCQYGFDALRGERGAADPSREVTDTLGSILLAPSAAAASSSCRARRRRWKGTPPSSRQPRRWRASRRRSDAWSFNALLLDGAQPASPAARLAPSRDVALLLDARDRPVDTASGAAADTK